MQSAARPHLLRAHAPQKLDFSAVEMHHSAVIYRLILLLFVCAASAWAADNTTYEERRAAAASEVDKEQPGLTGDARNAAIFAKMLDRGSSEKKAVALDPELKLNSLSEAQFKAFSKELIEASEDEKEEFKSVSKDMLIDMFGWKGKPDSQKQIFDLDPLWNRTLILSVIATHNKIHLDEDYMERFRKHSADVRLKTEDDGQRLMIAGLFDNVRVANDKLEAQPTK